MVLRESATNERGDSVAKTVRAGKICQLNRNRKTRRLNKPSVEIKEMIGHSSIATTERYLHGFDNQLEQLFDKYQI